MMETAATQEVVTDKRSHHLRVPVNSQEKAVIERYAALTNQSVAAWLRSVGQGIVPRSSCDLKGIEDLLRINADLGRLGGLLKLWLTDEPRALRFGVGNIRDLLHKIEGTQEKLLAGIEKFFR